MSAEYAFRVTGLLTPTLLTALDPLEANPVTTETLLVGWVADSAALHGHIAHIEALGLELVGLQRLPPALRTSGRPGAVPGAAGAALRRARRLSGCHPTANGTYRSSQYAAAY